MKKIRLTSINNENLIHPSELLLPVNGITNLVNLLENFEKINDEYLSRKRLRRKEQTFLEFLNEKHCLKFLISWVEKRISDLMRYYYTNTVMVAWRGN
jgi:hypothetical protein